MSRRCHPVLAAALALAALAAVLAAGCDDGPAPAGSAAGGGVSAGPPEPLRILSLAPNLTEILFAMGLGSRIVGRSTYCTYPPEARAVPAVGDTMHLDLAGIIRAEPTLAFLVTKRREAVRRLEGLGIRVVAVQADRMSQLREAIRTIGAETGRPGVAADLLDRIDSDLAAVRRQVAGLPRPRTLFAFPMTVGSSRIMVAGRGTFVDDLLNAAGAENAYPERADWPTVSPAQVVEMGPEVVIINAATEGPADRQDVIRRAWDELGSVPAVRDGRVHVRPEAYLTIPGPRVGQAARVLAETIHPELETSRAAGLPARRTTRAAKAPSFEPAAVRAANVSSRVLDGAARSWRARRAPPLARTPLLTQRGRRGGLERLCAPCAAGAETRRAGTGEASP